MRRLRITIPLFRNLLFHQVFPKCFFILKVSSFWFRLACYPSHFRMKINRITALAIIIVMVNFCVTFRHLRPSKIHVRSRTPFNFVKCKRCVDTNSLEHDWNNMLFYVIAMKLYIVKWSVMAVYFAWVVFDYTFPHESVTNVRSFSLWQISVELCVAAPPGAVQRGLAGECTCAWNSSGWRRIQIYTQLNSGIRFHQFKNSELQTNEVLDIRFNKTPRKNIISDFLWMKVHIIDGHQNASRHELGKPKMWSQTHTDSKTMIRIEYQKETFVE